MKSAPFLRPGRLGYERQAFALMLVEKTNFSIVRLLAVSRSGYLAWLGCGPSERTVRWENIEQKVAWFHSDADEVYDPRGFPPTSVPMARSSPKRPWPAPCAAWLAYPVARTVNHVRTLNLEDLDLLEPLGSETVRSGQKEHLGWSARSLAFALRRYRSAREITMRRRTVICQGSGEKTKPETSADVPPRF